MFIGVGKPRKKKIKLNKGFHVTRKQLVNMERNKLFVVDTSSKYKAARLISNKATCCVTNFDLSVTLLTTSQINLSQVKNYNSPTNECATTLSFAARIDMNYVTGRTFICVFLVI